MGEGKEREGGRGGEGKEREGGELVNVPLHQQAPGLGDQGG